MSDKKVIVYSSSVGGVIVQKNTIAMAQLVASTQYNVEPECRYLDQIPPEEKEEVFRQAGRGNLPVLFIDDVYIGNQDKLVDLNEEGDLAVLLGFERPPRD